MNCLTSWLIIPEMNSSYNNVFKERDYRCSNLHSLRIIESPTLWYLSVLEEATRLDRECLQTQKEETGRRLVRRLWARGKRLSRRLSLAELLNRS